MENTNVLRFPRLSCDVKDQSECAWIFLNIWGHVITNILMSSVYLPPQTTQLLHALQGDFREDELKSTGGGIQQYFRRAAASRSVAAARFHSALESSNGPPPGRASGAEVTIASSRGNHANTDDRSKEVLPGSGVEAQSHQSKLVTASPAVPCFAAEAQLEMRGHDPGSPTVQQYFEQLLSQILLTPRKSNANLVK